MEATKPIEEMSDAEISKAIKDETPFICYRDIYRPVISERLKQNESYCRVKQLYTEAAKGLREVLGILDEQPETADQFPNKKEVFNRIMELMRMLSDFECAELITLIREEYATGEFTLDRLMKEKRGESNCS